MKKKKKITPGCLLLKYLYFKILSFYYYYYQTFISPKKYRRAWQIEINFRKFISLVYILLYLEDNSHIFFSPTKETCIINETKLGRKSISKVNLKRRQDSKFPYGYQGDCTCFKTNWLSEVWICLSEEPEKRKSQQLKHLHTRSEDTIPKA